MDDIAAPEAPFTGVLEINLNDKNTLFAAYMPFIKQLGIFVATSLSFDLGQEVKFSLRMMDEKERYDLVGTVVWITPKGAQGGRAAGIGLQVLEADKAKIVKNKIETYLAGALQSDRRTETM